MSAPLWTAPEAAAATGGVAARHWAATGVSIDTRTLAPGDLFVALQAARDGHDFVAQALEKGAAAALVSRWPAGVAPGAPLLVVPDVLEGLRALGAAARARTAARVIGVTGSVGKTSTKEMLRIALARQGRVHAAEASYNNHWGVPLTLARMPRDTDFAVIEIGMNAPGEIAPLSRLARPHVAMVTTVAAAHLEAFGTLAGIAHEKASIFEGLEPGGTAVLHADLEETPILLEKAAAHTDAILRFGHAPEAEFWLREIRQTPEALVVEAQVRGQEILFKLPGAGRHFALNGLAALAAAEAAGADLALAAIDLAQWQPPRGRGGRETLRLDSVEPAEFTLIDDAYNANPASLGAALEMLAEAEPGPRRQGGTARGQRIAILGDMLELGPDEAALHAAVAELPALARIDIVHCVGPRMAHLWAALPEARRGRRVDTPEDLGRIARKLVGPGDVVLVKGSNGSRVARVVDALRDLGFEARHGARERD